MTLVPGTVLGKRRMPLTVRNGPGLIMSTLHPVEDTSSAPLTAMDFKIWSLSGPLPAPNSQRLVGQRRHGQAGVHNGANSSA